MTIISAEIRKKVQALLDKLQTPMNDIYKLIQGAGALQSGWSYRRRRTRTSCGSTS